MMDPELLWKMVERVEASARSTRLTVLILMAGVVLNAVAAALNLFVLWRLTR